MVECTCTECNCGETWKCLHNPEGDNIDPRTGEGYCKCCVDDSSLEDDGILYHKLELMRR